MSAARIRRLLTRSLALGATLLVLTGRTPAEAQEGRDWREFRAGRQAGDYESLQIDLVYGAGRFTISGADDGILYDVLLRYDANRFLPSRSWAVEDGRGSLRVSLRSKNGDDGEFDMDGLEFDLADLRRLDDSSGWLKLELGRSVPTDPRTGHNS